jgi:hypothetical protein
MNFYILLHSHIAWYVGEDNYYWICWENIQCDRVENWLGIWPCETDEECADCASELRVHLQHTTSGMVYQVCRFRTFLAYFPKMKVDLSNHQSVCVCVLLIP